eukprot:1143556-Pelagomonas_calceolata.AAC.5
MSPIAPIERAGRELPVHQLSKRRHIAQKSCELPPPRSCKTENTNGDINGGLLEAPGSITWL